MISTELGKPLEKFIAELVATCRCCPLGMPEARPCPSRLLDPPELRRQMLDQRPHGRQQPAA